MTFHDWSDHDFDWSGLYEAQEIVYAEMMRYGLRPLQIKEKFGTIRCYMGRPGITSLHDLFWPGHAFSRWPCTCGNRGKMVQVDGKWKYALCTYRCPRRIMVWADLYMWPELFRWTGVSWLTGKVHQVAYVRAYEKAVQAYPHLRDEILSDADWGELLLHMHDWNNYWVSCNKDRYPPPNPTWVAHLKQLEDLCLK